VEYCACDYNEIKKLKKYTRLDSCYFLICVGTFTDVDFFFLRGKTYGTFYLEANIVTSSSTKGIIKLGGASSQLTTEFDSKENLPMLIYYSLRHVKGSSLSLLQ
jgi:hypothetical protein